MNIIIVCYPTYGGSGILATELGKALALKEHNVHFVTYEQPVRLTSYSARLFYHEVRVPPYPLFNFPPYEIALASKLVEIISHHKIDIIHVHYAIPHATAAYIAQQIILQEKKIFIPFVTTLHGTDITIVGKDKSYESVVNFSINNSTVITAVSENLKTETLNYFRINKDIKVIYNFVDLERFKMSCCPDLKKTISLNNEVIICHASNFRKVKRIKDIILIFAQVLTQTPAILLMVGDGPERDAAEELSYSLGINHAIKFLGKQEDIENIFSLSDIFLLPSEYESFGLSALEAMASHNAIITSNSGGLPEINIHGETGYLVDVGEIDLFAKHIIHLIKNPSLLAKMKSNAYQQALKFNQKKIIPQYEELYLDLISKQYTAAENKI